ncbi:MAG: M23 family metallopeptidase [Candidatus Peribacteria bacterium]|nr:M23 family metallopeptidase [Candidatus Peribacteria bacterium]
MKEITLTPCTGDTCTFELPKIRNADYFSYRDDPLYRRVYSMLRLGTYFERWDVGIGSHQGVDIATAIGTPVYAIHEGKVIVAGVRGDWGKVIVIEHFWNTKPLYTVYAHLSEITVNVGDVVREKQLVGNTGETGNTTGPHLHFQIETNVDGDHPFFPKGCKGTIDELVNEGNCFSEVKRSTLDPIYFLEVSSKFGNSLSEGSGSIYIPKENIHIEGFVGGFMETNITQEFQIFKKDL